MGYEYIGEQGDFYLENPEMTSSLYFPLAIEAGIMGCVTPVWEGNRKLDRTRFYCHRKAAGTCITINLQGTSGVWVQRMGRSHCPGVLADSNQFYLAGKKSRHIWKPGLCGIK